MEVLPIDPTGRFSYLLVGQFSATKSWHRELRRKKKAEYFVAKDALLVLTALETLEGYLAGQRLAVLAVPPLVFPGVQLVGWSGGKNNEGLGG